MLNTLIQNNPPPEGTCTTWGEPAIMALPGVGGPTTYLAAACFDLGFKSQGYYIFYTTEPTLSTGWTYYSGPFDLSSLPEESYAACPLTPDSITELDWAQRAGGATMVAVVSLLNTQTPGTPMNCGCVALNFDLQNTVNPFAATFVATVSDIDAGTGQFYEQFGPNGCTYEPSSNTGIVKVRHLVNNALPPPIQQQYYSLIDSGIMP